MNILITGVNSGIGHATAKLLVAKGHNVIGSVRGSSLEEKGIDGVGYVVMDMTKPTSIEKGWGKALELCNGNIDCIFLNAGYGAPGAVEDIEWATLEGQFRCNVFGAHMVMKQFIKHKGHSAGGHIIVNSSVLGFFPIAYRGAYSASKHALEGLVGSLGAELKRIKSSINISVIQPGPIKTGFRERSLFELKRIKQSKTYYADYLGLESRLSSDEWGSNALSAEFVAHKVAKLIRNDKSAYVKINLGTFVAKLLTRVLPDRYRIWAASLGHP